MISEMTVTADITKDNKSEMATPRKPSDLIRILTPARHSYDVRRETMTPDDKRELDMLYISPYSWRGLDAWIVKFKYYPSGLKPKHHSKLFNFNKYESPNDALDAARVYRSEWLKDNGDKLWLNRFSQRLPKNNTSGILGLSRSTKTQPSGFIAEAWQTGYTLPDGTKKQTKFSVGRLGELEALRGALRLRRDSMEHLLASREYRDDPGVTELVGYYTDILESLSDLKDTSDEPSITEIVRNESLSPTSKFQQILGRIGQQTFRRNVIEYFNGRCAITESPVLIRASHIKPWRAASDRERLDPMNGLALSPTYDAAFDSGLITFRPDGLIMIDRLFAEDAKLLGISGVERIRLLSSGHASYLDWHRKNIFQAQKNKKANKSEMATPRKPSD